MVRSYNEKKLIGDEGFQLLLTPEGLRIQKIGYRLLINRPMNDTDKANVIWRSNNDKASVSIYNDPKRSAFYLRESKEAPGEFYIEVPYGETKPRLMMKTSNPIVYSDLFISRRKKDGYHYKDVANDPALWKIE